MPNRRIAFLISRAQRRATLVGVGLLALVLLVATVTGSARGGTGGDQAESDTHRSGHAPRSDGGRLQPGHRLLLQDGWAIRSSAEISERGAALATVGYSAAAWIPARVPTTVLAARVAHGDFPDPDYGMNLRRIPGTSDYPIGERFSLYDMSNSNPYNVSWWYRTEFELPQSGERIWLHFDGINYRANIWLNGKQVASDKEVAGAYRRYVFDVSALVRPGQRNALAVEVFAPGKNDLAPSYIDWNPMPADMNMGIWHDVYLTSSGPVRIEHPFVVSKVPSPKQARLTVNAELTNTSSAAVTATVAGTIDHIHFSEKIALEPHQSKSISITPEAHPELILASPKLWWPYELGAPNLHDLKLTVSLNGIVSDTESTRFGIREVSMDLVDGLWAQYKINGRPLLIRGAGYTSDLLFRFSEQRDEQEMQLVKDMGLNTIRIEGKLATDHLFDLTDREGILVMPGWECCSAWESWVEDQQKKGLKPWNEATRAVAAASLKSQLHRLRGRPSVITFLYGSDSHPPPDIERMYLAVIKEARWPLPAQNQASERDPSTLTGPSGFKMSGPYDYVPPSYWYVDNKHGGAFGFNSETGPGAAVVNLESLKKFVPEERLWPINDVWNYHMGGDRFGNLDLHTRALEARYGKPQSADGYALKAQALSYDGERAMFEAYRRNKGKSTGVIAWMLNNAWPSMLWHLYDYYLAAGGGYYGTKKANEPVHIQYSYDDQSVVVVNDSPVAVSGLKATAEVYDIHSQKLFSQEQAKLKVPTDKSVVALTLPPIANLGTTYFVRLLLRNGRDQLISQNFYWLSTKRDVLDWDKTDWWGTPVLEHGDLTALNSLPMVTPTVTASSNGGSGPARTIRVSVQNNDARIAFLLRFRLTKGGADEVLPSFWSDNYLSLLPGEKRELIARYSDADLGGARPVMVLSGWNVSRTTVQVSSEELKRRSELQRRLFGHGSTALFSQGGWPR